MSPVGNTVATIKHRRLIREVVEQDATGAPRRHRHLHARPPSALAAGALPPIHWQAPAAPPRSWARRTGWSRWARRDPTCHRSAGTPTNGCHARCRRRNGTCASRPEHPAPARPRVQGVARYAGDDRRRTASRRTRSHDRLPNDRLPNEWGPTLADLAERRAGARAMGGEERLARHRARASSTRRARVAALLDPGSFRELGTLVGDVPADAFIAGSGVIAGRPVMVGAEDFTVVAGTIATGSNAKRLRLAELALQEHVPLVMMLEGAGFRPTERSHGRSMTDLVMQARCSGLIPMVTAVLGASAGHGALDRADLRLHRHDGGGVDLHGRATGGEAVDRGGRRQARARRSRGGGRQRSRAQRRRRRRRRVRPAARVPVVLPVERVVVSVVGRHRRSRVRARFPSCCRSSRATTAGSTTCGPSSTSSSTAASGSRYRPASARRSSAHSRTSAATRW